MLELQYFNCKLCNDDDDDDNDNNNNNVHFVDVLYNYQVMHAHE
jgi:hypothetical protein